MASDFSGPHFPTELLSIQPSIKKFQQRFGNLGQSALLAQWLERAAVNRKVTGSIPVGSVVFSVTYENIVSSKTPRPGIEPGSSA